MMVKTIEHGITDAHIAGTLIEQDANRARVKRLLTFSMGRDRTVTICQEAASFHSQVQARKHP